eukprot:765648-Hanusia_phi.AAC.4
MSRRPALIPHWGPSDSLSPGFPGCPGPGMPGCTEEAVYGDPIRSSTGFVLVCSDLTVPR